MMKRMECSVDYFECGWFEGEAVVVAIILIVKILQILQSTEIILSVLDQPRKKRVRNESMKN